MSHDRWVTEIRPVGKDRCEVVCESEDSFILYRQEIERYGIEAQSACSGETYDRICEEVFRGRAKKRCMYLLERQDYTEAQIRRKLEEGRYPSGIIDETVEWLYSFHALDDRRYTENFLRTNRDRYSRRTLEEKLLQRGIPKTLTAQVMEEGTSFMPDEAAQIREILARKQYDPARACAQETDQIRQMLARKGYGYDLIRKLT